MVPDPPNRCAIVDVGVIAEREDSRILHPAREEIPRPAYGGLLPRVDVMPVKTVHENDAGRRWSGS